MSVTVRNLLPSDLGVADTILSSAFQRSGSWFRELSLFLKLQPDGIFLASQDGLPAGMVATILYSDYAYVGLMGVHRNFQRQGLGMVLMQHVLDQMQAKSVPVVRLDASPFGQPLYEKLGFVPHEEVYVLQTQKREMNGQQPTGIEILTSHHLDLLASPDFQAFGADRTRLLQALLETYPSRAFLQQNAEGQIHGYLFAQEKRIGPWVMAGDADPEPLLQAALSLPFPGPVSIIVPAENRDAISLLQRHGFETVRVNRHMSYGSPVPAGQRRQIFGQTSLSMG